VDGLWVKQKGFSQPEDFQPLLEEVAARTSLPVALDGVYRWVAFLPSRLDARLPVPNRYFGVFQDGSVKARGIDLRRRDSAPFIADVQREMLRCLARAGTPEALRGQVDEAVGLLRMRLRALKEGRVPLQDLIAGKKLSKELTGYRVPSPGARAAMQLLEAGKTVRPGQRVRLIFTRGQPGVHAWDLPELPDPAAIDTDYYTELMLRAASSLLQPFGLSEEDLRILTCDDLGEQMNLPLHAWRREQPSPIYLEKK